MAFLKLAELPKAIELSGEEIIPCTQQGVTVAATINDIVNAAAKRVLEVQASVPPVYSSIAASAMLGAAGVVAAKNPTISRRFWAWLK